MVNVYVFLNLIFEFKKLSQNIIQLSLGVYNTRE